MKTFGRLVKKMRGRVDVAEVARRCGFEAEFLRQVEVGAVVLDPRAAVEVLRLAFGLDKSEARRAVLGIQLYDLGLRDNDIRQLVLDLIQKTVPARVTKALKGLYASYTVS